MEFIYEEDEPRTAEQAVAMIDYFGNLCFRPERRAEFTQLYLSEERGACVTLETPFDQDAREAQKLFFPGDEITIKF